jgi:glucosyl-dolichyl phosphate glucuronosyltransferase
MKHSIIIPTFNGEKFLSTTIKSLVSQNFGSSEFEILIIDNASTDGTKTISKQMIEQYPDNNIRYIFESVPGLLSGRHRGAKEALGDLLSFIDDDIIADKNWLQSINYSFVDETISLVGGKNIPKFEIEPPSWISDFWQPTPFGGKSLAHLSLIDLGEERIEISPDYVWGLNFSIRKNTLIESGGFNPDTYPKYLQKYQGDGENGLAQKLIENRIKTEYNPGAIVYHIIPKERLTLDFFRRRRYFQGVGDSYTHLRKGVSLNTESNKFLQCGKSLKNWLFYSIMYLFVNGKSRKILKIKKDLRVSYKSGYKFHQKQFEQDPNLLKWIKQENYWNYTLPESIAVDDIVASQKSY